MPNTYHCLLAIINRGLIPDRDDPVWYVARPDGTTDLSVSHASFNDSISTGQSENS